jgi:hypothetical protein
MNEHASITAAQPKGSCWADAGRLYGARLKRANALRKAGHDIVITERQSLSLMGFPIREVDAATRALIDEAIAAGRVTRIERGAGAEEVANCAHPKTAAAVESLENTGIPGAQLADEALHEQCQESFSVRKRAVG